MRVIKYLKDSKIAVALIILLLVVQAFTDLSLPRLTASIVDIGIQQSGVENVSPAEMREPTYETVRMLTTDENERLIVQAYFQEENGNYKLGELTAEQREELDDTMAMPLVVAHYSDHVEDFDIDQILLAYDAGQITKSDIQEGIDRVLSEVGGIDESIIAQMAVQATIAEYEALGYDLGQMQMDYLIRIGVVMAGLAALGMVVAIGVSFMAARTAAKIGRDLRSRFFSRVVGFSDAEIQGFSAASLITRGTNDIQQIQMVSVMFLRMLLYAPILALGGIFMISQTNASMSWIIVLAVGVILAFIIALFTLVMPKFKLMQKLIDKVNLVSREILTGLQVVRAFGRQDFEEKRFDDANARLRENQLFVNRAMAFMMPTMMLVMNGISVLIVWVGGSYIDAGTLQTGDMIAFITYSMTIIMSFLMISVMGIMIPRADVAAQRIDEVIDTQSTIHDPDVSRDGEVLKTEGATISFNHVDFMYPGAEANVLSDITFTAPAGKMTAFIGSTGSGKSTIIKLIERFYDVSAGSITLDGVDIRELSQEELRSNFGYVPQKAFLFSGTIHSNIAYADETMAQESIELAAEISQSSDFIAEKDEGYDAPISQGGTNVSGGQRQRLAIARAIASGARAFLFDDSFSALDYRTDAALRGALSNKLSGKTVLIVAQRVSTIMNADRIVVLEEGRIVGIGTHKELLKTSPCYKEIALSQLSEQELTGGDAA